MHRQLFALSLVVIASVALVFGAGTAQAAIVSFDYIGTQTLTSAAGATDVLDFTLTASGYSGSANTTVTGTYEVELVGTADTSAGTASITGLQFITQSAPGPISCSNFTISLAMGLEHVAFTGLKGDLTMDSAGTIAVSSGGTYNLSTTNLLINAGTASATGISSASVDFGANPSTASLAGASNGTITLSSVIAAGNHVSFTATMIVPVSSSGADSNGDTFTTSGTTRSVSSYSFYIPTTYTWNAGSSSFSTGANWTAGGSSGTVPTSIDTILMTNSGTINLGGSQTVGQIGSSSSGITGTFTNGTLTASGDAYATSMVIGSGVTLNAANVRVGASGAAGSLTQTGGQVSASSVVSVGGSGGSYTISGGTINAGGMWIGDAGGGTLTQSGASVVNSPGYIVVGNDATGVYNLQGGSIATGNIYLGWDVNGTGKMNISGGTINCGNFALGWGGTASQGSVTQTGGSVSIAPGYVMNVGGTGAAYYTISAGTITGGTVNNPSSGTAPSSTLQIGQSGAPGAATMTIGTSSSSTGSVLFQNLMMAGTTSATLNVHGGTLSIKQNFEMADSTGSAVVNQDGGLVKEIGCTDGWGWMPIGFGGAAAYNISGGTLSFGNTYGNASLYVGFTTAGTLSVSGTGRVSVANNILDIAASNGFASGGNGTLAISGGTVSAAGLNVGYTATGTVTMSGGSLSVGAYGFNVGSASCTGGVTQSGGSVSVAAGGSVSVGNGGPGQYTITGGRLIGSTTDSPLYSSSTSLFVGNNSAATFTVGTSSSNTGSVSFQNLSLGGNSGTIFVHGGTLAIKQDFILNANAVVNQDGGLVQEIGCSDPGQGDDGFGWMPIGWGGTAAYNISGGTLNYNNPATAGGLYVGFTNAGTVAVSGSAVVNVNSTLHVADALDSAGGAIGGDGTLAISGGAVSALGMNVGYSSTGAVTISDGALTVGPYGINVGAAGYTGGISQTGGLVTLGGSMTIGTTDALNPGLGAGTGSYTISAGTITGGTCDNPAFGGTGTTVYVGNNGLGTFTMGTSSGSTGSVLVQNLYLGGSSGTMFVHGGTLAIKQDFDMYANAVVNQDGGWVHEIGCNDPGQADDGWGWLPIGWGGTAAYNISGGTLSMDHSAGNGVYVGFNGAGTLSVSGSAVVNFNNTLHVADAYDNSGVGGGNGTLAISGGAVSAVGLNVGYSATGTVTISDGALTVGSNGFNIGACGYTGGVTQTGGLVTLGGSMTIGTTDPNPNGIGLGAGTGSYNISGGTLSAPSSWIFVGYGGPATFTQSGDSYVNPLAVQIGAGSDATYNLQGGTLSTAVVFVGNSPYVGTLNVSGGNLQASQDIYIGCSGSSSHGYVYQTGGYVSSPYVDVGSDGPGNYSISAGTLDASAGSIQVGDHEAGRTDCYGPGIFTQTGGAVSAGTLSVGNLDNGSYSISASTSTISAGTMYVGYNSGVTGTFTQYDGAVTIDGSLYVGGGQGANSGATPLGGSGSYSMSTGTLNVGNRTYVGYSGNGTFTQSGGVASSYGLYIGCAPGYGGTASFSGGSFTSTDTISIGYSAYGGATGQSGEMDVSGTAYVEQTGSDLSVGEQVDSTALLNVSGGTLNFNNPYGTFYVGRGVGAVGTIVQTGGYVSSAGTVYIGYNGTGYYTISAGIFNALGDVYVGDGAGYLTVGTSSGNTPSVAITGSLNVGSGTTGTVQLQGGSISVGTDLNIGGNGTGAFTQSNSTTLNVTGSIYVGGVGEYDSGDGTYTLSAGTATVANCYVASGAATGTVNINGGVFNDAGSFVVGNGSSAGTVAQTAGVVNMGSDMTGIGVYNLSGGSLNPNGHNIGVAAMTFSGGTITNAGTVSSTITLASGTGGVFQQSTGSTTTVSGSIGGTGNLTKIGAGSLILTGSLTYAGTTTIAAGMLDAPIAALTTLVSPAINVKTSASKLLLDYSSDLPGKSGYDAEMQSILKASYGAVGGHFASGAIYSSGAAGAGAALGWKDNGSGMMTVAYTLYGDANLDGTVNGADLNNVLSNFQKTGFWYQGDFNYDGTVNGADLNTVLSNFQKVVGSSMETVPEPSTLLLAAAGLAGLLAYAWRKRS